MVQTAVYEGVEYPSIRLAQRARREHYLRLVRSGMNFTQAARMVGVSKRTGKVWRNGRTRSTGRNEHPSVDWYRGNTEQPKTVKILLNPALLEVIQDKLQQH